MFLRPRFLSNEKMDLDMTAMIDVVFQLLIFFMLSFKISTIEGDFNLKLPLAAPPVNRSDGPQVPPLKVRMQHDDDGTLRSLALNGQPVADFASLRQRIIQSFGTSSGPCSDLAAAEVELDCDYDLKYEYVIRAVTSVSGYSERGQVVKLVENIKFAPPRVGGD